MNAVPSMKISDRLRSFASEAQSELPHSGLTNLDVFHRRSSIVDEFLEVSTVPEKTYAQGLEEGRLLVASEGVQHLETTAELVQGLQHNLSALGAQIQASHSRAITTILRAVLPRLAEQEAGAEIHGFLERIVGQALHGEVVLKVNPTYEKDLNEIVTLLGANGFNAPEFTIKLDENMSGHAVNAEWHGGGGAIDIDEAVRNCLALISPIDENYASPEDVIKVNEGGQNG